MIDFLLFYGIEHTNAHPWIGFVGAAVTGLIGATVMKVLS